MNNRTILLVEDNPKDELLTLRTLKKCNLANEIKVVRDGAEALEYLFATGEYAGRSVDCFPTLVLLDLKLPKIAGYELGANSYVRKPVAFSDFSKAVAELGRYWMITNEPLPKKGGRTR